MMTSPVRFLVPPAPGETDPPAQSTPDAAASLFALLFGALLQGATSGPGAARAGLSEGTVPAAAPPLSSALGGSRAGKSQSAFPGGEPIREPARTQAGAGTPDTSEIIFPQPFSLPCVAPGQGLPADPNIRDSGFGKLAQIAVLTNGVAPAELGLSGLGLLPRGEVSAGNLEDFAGATPAAGEEARSAATAPDQGVPAHAEIARPQPGTPARALSAPKTALDAGEIAFPQPESAPDQPAPDPRSPVISAPELGDGVHTAAASANSLAALRAPMLRHVPTGRTPAAVPAAQSASQGLEGTATIAPKGAGGELPARSTSDAAPGRKLARDLEAFLPAGSAPDCRDGPIVSGAEILDVDAGPGERGAEPMPAPVRAAAAAAPPPALQLGMQIVRAASSRIERMVVELDPAELGRIEIRLEFGEEGRVQAAIAAERVETLEWLQRDAAALERTLREAGLRPDAGGLSFSLKREQPGGDGGDHGSGQRMPTRAAVGPVDVGGAPASEAAHLTLRLLDIRA